MWHCYGKRQRKSKIKQVLEKDKTFSCRYGSSSDGHSEWAGIDEFVLEEMKFKVNIVLRESTVVESVKTEEDSEEQLNVGVLMLFNNGRRQSKIMRGVWDQEWSTLWNISSRSARFVYVVECLVI